MAGKKLIIITTMFLSLILLAGCFDGIRIPLGDGNSIQISTGDEGVSFNFQGEEGSMGFSAEDGTFTIADQDGSATVYREIPEHFPAYLPVPSDIEPVGNFVTIAELKDGSEVYALAYQVEVEREAEVTQLYENFLTSNNFEVHEESDESGKTISAESEDAIFNLGIYQDDAVMVITFHYTLKGEGEEE